MSRIVQIIKAILGIGFASLIVNIFAGPVIQNFRDSLFSGPIINVDFIEIKEWSSGEGFNNVGMIVFSSYKDRQMLNIIKNVSFDSVGRDFAGVMINPNFTLCEGCVGYNLIAINNGKSEAKNIEIKLFGNLSDIPISPGETGKNILSLDCLGKEDKECLIKIKTMEKGLMLPLYFLGGEGDINISCSVNGKHEFCHLDYINVFSRQISSEEIASIKIGDISIKAPEIEPSDKPECFYLDKESLRWLSVQCDIPKYSPRIPDSK